MRWIFNILSVLTGIYSVLIFIRILLSWFGSFSASRPVELLANITDPYLNWWRRRLSVRIGALDFSAIFGIVALSMAQRIFSAISYYDRISLGIVLAIVLSSLWGIISFITGFFLIAFILRLIACLTNRDLSLPLWRLVDSITRPLLSRMGRIFRGGGIIGSIVTSIVLLAAIWLGGRIAMPFLAGLLSRLPI